MPRSRHLLRRKYLSHAYQYDVEGEDLPSTPTTDKIFVPRLKATAAISVPLFFVFESIINVAYTFYMAVRVIGPQQTQIAAEAAKNAAAASSSAAAAATSASSAATVQMPQFQQIPFFATAGKAGKVALAHWMPIVNGNLVTHTLALVVAVVLAWMIAQRFNYASRSVAHDQLGDAKLMTITQIKERYKEIPEKDGSFPGNGGIAVSHYKNKFYINEETVNTLVLGTSRSGKGQSTVISTIDNLSRAKKQSSMVVNDPKGELFVAAKTTLEKRGYDVHVLNLDDPLQSMSYNPLSLITKAWVRGDIETATQLINTLTHALYASDDAGENKWVYEGAQHAVNGMIMTLLKYCVAHNCTEKVTLYNVSEMLNELGSLNYVEDPEKDIQTTNALDAYFQSLPASDEAKKQYGSTSFSGEKAKGSILSTVNEGLSPFELPKNAKMTSLNSLEMKSIGFPKYVTIQFQETMFRQLMNIQFFRNKKLIAAFKVRVGANGFTEYNFDTDLQEGDIMVIRNPKDADEKRFSSFKLHFEEARDVNTGEVIYKKLKGHEKEPEISKDVQLKQLHNNLDLKSAEMYYSEKPVALFMLIPDSDTSNHALASIFIRQLYTELAKQTRNSPGKKCTRRVHFVLDEFGNMIKIPDMAQILTVTNGRNMLWDLFIQSYQQLNSKYGDADTSTIRENCQLTVYIFSQDPNTQEEIVSRLGNSTELSETSSKTSFNINEGVQQNAEADALITKERIGGLLIGETIVFDPLHRQDNHHRKVRSRPIFNTKETVMPYAYQFLKDEFDPDGDINEIDIESQHATMSLEDNAIDYRAFIVSDAGVEEYDRRLASGAAKPMPKAADSPVGLSPYEQAVSGLTNLGLSQQGAEMLLNMKPVQAHVKARQIFESEEDISKVEVIMNRYFAAE